MAVPHARLCSDVPDDVVSCRDLASNHLVQATVFLLNRVTGTSIPAQLPDGVAARHRFCTNLGKRIKVALAQSGTGCTC